MSVIYTSFLTYNFTGMVVLRLLASRCAHHKLFVTIFACIVM